MKKISLMVLCFTFSLFIMAQTKKSFTLDDLLPGGDTYYQIQPEQLFVTWWGNIPVQQTVDSCFAIDVDTKEKETLFTTEILNNFLGGDKLRSCMDVHFPSADRPLVNVVVSDNLSINEEPTQQYITLNFKTGQIVATQSIPLAATHIDRTDATGNIAYVKQHNLYTCNSEGKIMAVSSDGSNDVTYGEEAYRFEFGITKGTFWSPDGNSLAFYRVDQSMVPDYPQVDITTRIASTIPCKYPMAGEPSHKATVGVFSVNTGQTTWLDVGDPTDRYFTNISWSPDSRKIYIIELPRTQNHAELVCYDAATGQKEAVLYEETHPKYVEPMHGLSFLPWDTSKAIYQSRRDGYNHLYLFDLDSETESSTKQTNSGGSYKENIHVTQLTSGPWEVDDIVCFDCNSRSIVYRSNETHLLQSDVFAVNTETYKRSILSRQGGMHTAIASKDGRWLFDRFTSPTVARRIDLIRVQDGKSFTLLDAPDPWAEYEVPEITCGTIKAADGITDLYYRMVKPVHFDPKKKYPTVVYVYGGPHLHNVDASRNYMARGWEIYMAQKGYLLFILDNRGAERRGMDFESVTFHHFGVEEMKDQMEGVRFLRSLPYVDSERMGVHGWSYGGYMTINLMLTYPDVFKVGVAGGPVIDWKYYEVMYGERYMGTPENNPDGYAECSLIPKAGNLKGKLQIIIGYNDPICVPQHTLSFLRASIDSGTHPDLFVYPGSEHNMMGKERVHLHERITQYFEDFLK